MPIANMFDVPIILKIQYQHELRLIPICCSWVKKTLPPRTGKLQEAEMWFAIRVR